MHLIKVVLVAAFVVSFASCSIGDSIYGTWRGKSSGENSYTWIEGPSKDGKKQPTNGREKYSRAVDLVISNEGCEIVFDSNFDEPVGCSYSRFKKAIIVPLWRDEDSIYDSGLKVVALNESSLELENRFTRIFSDYDDDKFEMTGIEFYSLTKIE